MATLWTGDHRHDNNLTERRFRHKPAPTLPTEKFRYLMNGNYEVVIPNCYYGFTVKAYTPDQCWRIFYLDSDGDKCELNTRIPFAMPAVEMWGLLAHTAYGLQIEEERKADEATSPPPSLTCPVDAEIPW